MKKEFIPYEQALALKELGFDESKFGFYSLTPHSYPIDKWGICATVNVGDFLDIETFKYLECLFSDFKSIQAPLYQQTFKWFRNIHNLNSYIEDIFYAGTKSYVFVINGDVADTINQDAKNTYEEAELACLKKLIEIVKQKK